MLVIQNRLRQKLSVTNASVAEAVPRASTRHACIRFSQAEVPILQRAAFVAKSESLCQQPN